MIEDKQKLQLRVLELEKQKQFTEKALGLAIELGDSIQDLLEFQREEAVFEKILSCIDLLEVFEISSVYLCEKKERNFNLFQCSPLSRQYELQSHVDFFIESGFFALSLGENHGTILQSQDYSASFFVHPLKTAHGIQGMFIGMLKHNQSIPATSLQIISLALRQSASVFENLSKIRSSYEQNKSLEQEVQDKLKELTFQATHDPLTKLGNRTLLVNELDETFMSSSKRIDALLLMDIDNFREINDTIGHLEGDNLLIRVAQRLKRTLPQSGLITRNNGDEFATLIKNISSRGEVSAIAQYITETFKKPFLVSGHHLLLELSIGIVLLPEHATSTSEALKKADIAMYLAKKERSLFRFYEESMDYFSIERMVMIADMANALNVETDFYLVYQPKVNLDTNTICGVEALIRWNHPQHGLVSPATFVPLAERGGNIKKMTMLVIKKAIIQAKKWCTEGRNIPIAINLSMLNLQDPELSNHLIEIIKKQDIPPQLIELEITESVIMTAPSESIRHLVLFKNMGIKIYIDDFGTGYSTLGYLTKLPISSLKIDSSFIIPMLKDHHCHTIVETVIQLGHTFNLEIVAEGIEDEATLHELKKLSCDSGQGYYICKPQKAEELEEWLQERRKMSAE